MFVDLVIGMITFKLCSGVRRDEKLLVTGNMILTWL